MKTTAYYSGTIEVHKDGCYVGGQKIECPQGGQSLLERPFLQSGVYEPGSDRLDLLPQNPILDIRHDFLFITVFLAVALGFLLTAVFKIKIFGRTLTEYLKPIWYLVLISIATVFWQYLFGVNLEGNSPLLIASQLIWELCIAVSAYKLIKEANFGYRHLFFLGILYSLIIHGLKVSIRYFFYAKTLWYALDRFLYGSLLVMGIVFLGGSLYLFFRRRGILK